MYDRRAIFLRAHQLRHWNRGGYFPTAFGYWLRMAWAEAKAGTLPSFAPVDPVAAEIAEVRERIVMLEHTDRLGIHGLALLRAARAELSFLTAAA